MVSNLTQHIPRSLCLLHTHTRIRPRGCALTVGSSYKWVTSEKSSQSVSDPSCGTSRSAVFLCHGSAVKPYSERNALAVWFQSTRGSAKAFEQAMYRKSARLQQRRRTGGWWLAARADKGWSGCAVLGNGKAHLGELASPPPPAQCAALRAHAVALVHGAA